MPKYLTTTTIIGLLAKGQKILPGKLVELDPLKPEHKRLIVGGDVVLYVPPKAPEEAAAPQIEPLKPPHQTSTEQLVAEATAAGVQLTGEESHADLVKIVKDLREK